MFGKSAKKEMKRKPSDEDYGDIQTTSIDTFLLCESEDHTDDILKYHQVPQYQQLYPNTARPKSIDMKKVVTASPSPELPVNKKVEVVKPVIETTSLEDPKVKEFMEKRKARLETEKQRALAKEMVQEARKLKIAPTLIAKDKKFITDEPLPESNESLLKKNNRVKSVPISSTVKHHATLAASSNSSYGSEFFSNVLDDSADHEDDILLQKAEEISYLVDQMDVTAPPPPPDITVQPILSTQSPSLTIVPAPAPVVILEQTNPTTQSGVTEPIPTTTPMAVSLQNTRNEYDETHIQHPKNAEILATCLALLQQTQSFVSVEPTDNIPAAGQPNASCASSLDSSIPPPHYSNANIQMALIWLRQANHFLNQNKGHQ